VGQGGYGSVFLARKADTGEVCALKKMKKTTLAKMDEVKHVLIERDILTATKTPWLVSLLYAFQDRDHVYLAMVSPVGRNCTNDSLIVALFNHLGICTRW
jgi:cell cycle protein kinase DBF2